LPTKQVAGELYDGVIVASSQTIDVRLHANKARDARCMAVQRETREPGSTIRREEGQTDI
jgi:hypothetical protein